jgi:hypothetical protein
MAVSGVKEHAERETASYAVVRMKNNHSFRGLEDIVSHFCTIFSLHPYSDL